MKKYIYYFILFFLFFLSGCRVLIPALVVLGSGGWSSPEDFLKTDLLNEQCQKDFQRDCLIFGKVGEMMGQGDFLYIVEEGAIHKIFLPSGELSYVASLETSWRPIEISPSGLTAIDNTLYVSFGTRQEVIQIQLDTKESRIILDEENFILSQKQEDFFPTSLFTHEKKLYFVEYYSGTFFLLNSDNKVFPIAGNGVAGIKDGVGRNAQFLKPFDAAKGENILWMLNNDEEQNSFLRSLHLETMEAKTFPNATFHDRYFAIAADEQYVYLASDQTIYRYDPKTNESDYLSGDYTFYAGQFIFHRGTFASR